MEQDVNRRGGWGRAGPAGVVRWTNERAPAYNGVIARRSNLKARPVRMATMRHWRYVQRAQHVKCRVLFRGQWEEAGMVEGSALSARDVAEILDRCRHETERFFREQASDNRYCLELFRRALDLRNDYAWNALVQVYGNLVRRWLRQSGDLTALDYSLDELITLSFEKFWHAMRHRAGLEEYHSLQPLLHYLRVCCASVVTDALRWRMRRRVVALIETESDPLMRSQYTVEQEVARREERQEVWRRVSEALNGEEERVLLLSYYHAGMKPRQIREQFPDYFPRIEDVYRTKRKVINRLRNQPELREIWESL